MLTLSDWLRKMLGGGPTKEPSDLGTPIEGVAPHSHCEKCGKAITLGKRFCSELCKRGEGKGGMSSLFWIFLLLMLLMLMWGR